MSSRLAVQGVRALLVYPEFRRVARQNKQSIRFLKPTRAFSPSKREQIASLGGSWITDDAHFSPLHPPTCSDCAVEPRHPYGRRSCVLLPSGGGSSKGGLPHDLRPWRFAGGQSGNHGVLSRNAARAPIRPHRWHHGD